MKVNEPGAISGGLPNYWLPAGCAELMTRTFDIDVRLFSIFMIGRLDAGEDFKAAARRETHEEAGVEVHLHTLPSSIFHVSMSGWVAWR